MLSGATPQIGTKEMGVGLNGLITEMPAASVVQNTVFAMSSPSTPSRSEAEFGYTRQLMIAGSASPLTVMSGSGSNATQTPSSRMPISLSAIVSLMSLKWKST